MKTVALIGGGFISTVHRDAYRQLEAEGRAKLVACCSKNAEEFSELEGVRFYDDFEKLILAEKGKIDCLDICLPTFLHENAAILGMENGFDVICEKPMARTVEEAERMAAAALRTGRTLMIAQSSRFGAIINAARDFVFSGKMGTLRSIGLTRYQGVANYTYKSWANDNRLSGGALLDLHIHDVDMLNWFFGKPEAVSVMGKAILCDVGFDALAANFRYKDFFVHAACDWTLDNNKYQGRTMRFNMEKGYLFNDRADEGRKVYKAVWYDGREEDIVIPQDAPTDYYNEISYFLDCVERGVAPEQCTPQSTVDTLRIIRAEEESARNGGKLVEL